MKQESSNFYHNNNNSKQDATIELNKFKHNKKVVLLFIVTFLLSVIAFAQSNSINYKALIKDGSGNVVANQNITVQFSILKGVAQTNVYQETHTPTTDANGFVILNIGEGTIDSGDYSTIIWGSNDHFLNVQIDTGSGLVDMGTTQFMAVPYALNVTGLETLDEGNGIGWRLKGQDLANYGDIGFNAVDLSYSNTVSTTNGATGSNSTAMGNLTEATGGSSTAMGTATTASGDSSTAMGIFTEAPGDASTAMGRNTEATGNNSTAMGRNTEATGNSSTTMGRNTEASGYNSTAMGRYNIGGGNPTTWVETDPLLEVGNGTSSINRTNALTILKNGTITAPTFDLAEITDAKALITKEYADTNLVSTGLDALDEGNGIGWRLKEQDPANYGDIGLSAVDLSYSSTVSTTRGATGDYSTAMGRRTEATGNYSTAMGDNSEATGFGSTAMGSSTYATGVYSTTMGLYTYASGYGSTAMGRSTEASGVYSTAMGYDTETIGYISTAMGRYNIGGGDPTTWVETDPLFEVGNGASIISKSNALTILKNGTITAPTFDLAEITDAKALITKEYLEANSSTGLDALDEGNGIGWRLKGQDPANYGNIGLNAVDLSYNNNFSITRGASGDYSTAMGFRTEATGSYSTAMGGNTEATGDYSTAMGSNTEATGDYSTAMGSRTKATGDYSTAMGNNTEATGDFSTAMGRFTVASGFASTAMGGFTDASGSHSTAIGRYNIGGGNSTTWIETDPLFEVGNGTSSVNRTNALTILKNGDIGIGNTPSTNLHIFHGSNAGSDGFRIQNTGANNNWFRFYINNTSGNLNLYSNIGGSPSIGNFNDASGVYSATSDRRLKTNFNELHFNWKGFMKLNTLTYNYKVQKDSKKHIGLIAQEVEKIYPELVSYNKESDVYHLNYSGFGVIAIKAIQEQQKIINNQQQQIEMLETALLTKDEAYSGLNNRLKKIEALLIDKSEEDKVVSSNE